MYEIVCMKLQFYVILAFPTSSNRVEKEISCPTFPVVPNSTLKIMDINGGIFLLSLCADACTKQMHGGLTDGWMD